MMRKGDPVVDRARLPRPYYDADGVTLYCGDARLIAPHLDAVDHVVTDPPFSEATHTGARTARNYAFTTGETDRPLITFAPLAFDDLAAILNDLTIRRWLVAFMDWRHVAAFEVAPPDGLRFVRFGVWVKPNSAPQFTGDRPAPGWEAVAVMHAEGKMRWNGGGSRAVWTCAKEPHNAHPTQKPLPLIRQIVEQFTDPGDVILDPFMGSGTTLRAARDAGRRAIGIELDEAYCALAVQRLTHGHAGVKALGRGQKAWL